MGTIAAETMVSQLKGDAVTVKVHIVPTQLVLRNSCCALKQQMETRAA
jgi:DNA-binding LacI/PurR family transcriptional regulator